VSAVTRRPVSVFCFCSSLASPRCLRPFLAVIVFCTLPSPLCCLRPPSSNPPTASATSLFSPRHAHSLVLLLFSPRHARSLVRSLTHLVFGWVRSYAWAGIDITPFPKLAAWIDRIESRPGAYAGLGVPTRGKKLTKEEEEEKAKEAQAWIMADQKK
jgi:hypothetical protein